MTWLAVSALSASFSGLLSKDRLNEASRKVRLKQVRENDRKHDEAMTEIAERGGKTLAQVRAMSKYQKDDFITRFAK